MAQAVKNDDTTIKLTKKTLEQLASKAKPFESKKEVLERVIMQNCGSQKEANEELVEESSEEQQRKN